MEPCTFSDIEADFDHTLALVATDHHIDPICSSSPWIVPLADAFSSRSARRVFASDRGYLALLEHATPSGAVLTGFDAVWGFATPFVGHDAAAIVADAAHVLRAIDFHALMLSGIDPDGPLFDAVRTLGPTGFTDTADRCVADLRDGFDPWLARRSSRFRRSLRAAVNRGERRGVVVEQVQPVDDADVAAAFERLLAIEKTSWKTDVQSGLVDTKLGQFTRAMAGRFAANGQLRLQFARLDGADIGYVIGARVGDRYRGFQHSFNQSYPELAIGKLLQYHTINALAAEGVQSYDMGMHMTYKESYIDRIETTVTLVIAGS